MLEEREQNLTEGRVLHFHIHFDLRLYREQGQAGNKTDHARKHPGVHHHIGNTVLENACSPLLKIGH